MRPSTMLCNCWMWNPAHNWWFQYSTVELTHPLRLAGHRRQPSGGQWLESPRLTPTTWVAGGPVSENRCSPSFLGLNPTFTLIVALERSRCIRRRNQAIRYGHWYKNDSSHARLDSLIVADDSKPLPEARSPNAIRSATLRSVSNTFIWQLNGRRLSSVSQEC